MKSRNKVKKEDKWDLSLIYSSEQAWDDDFSETKKQSLEIEKIKERFETAEEVGGSLDLYFTIMQNIDKLYNYASRKFDEDITDNESNIRLNKVRDLYTLFSEKTTFIYTTLTKKSVEFLNKIAKHSRLKDYQLFIKDIIRAKDHTLSDGEEKILAKLSEALLYSENIFGKISDSDLKFPEIDKNGEKIEVSHGNYIQLLQDSDRQVRKDAMVAVFSSYKSLKETLSQNIFQHIKGRVNVASIKKHNSAISSFNFADNLDPAVYENLFEEANNHLHLLHRYCAIRKKVLGYDKLYWHDLYVPLIEDIDYKISYKEAVDLILEAIKPLGDDYVEIANIAFKKERWVDKYENKGKRSGAYSGGSYKNPAYILMNFNGSSESVSTLAHELGHSIHSYLSSQNNHFSEYDYPIFLAEIASTFNEELLTDLLLKKADSKMRLYLVNKQLEDIRRTFFRQTMFAEFEKGLYDYVQAGEMLTTEYLEKEYYKINKKYYGKVVELDELVSFEWSRIPHFYYNFYVYKYATGLSMANYFSNSVKNGGEKELDSYLNLLKAGGSDYPIDLLKKSGLDISNSDYIKSLMKKFESLMDEFESEMSN